MVRLNKNTLTKQQLDKLFSQLSAAISPGDTKHSYLVLSNLLGYEERVMIAKRLATAILLVEGFSKYKVGKLLKLSQSTVDIISTRVQKGDFDYTLKNIGKTKKNYFAFLEVLDSVLHLGGILPHYNGLDRYRFMR